MEKSRKVLKSTEKYSKVPKIIQKVAKSTPKEPKSAKKYQAQKDLQPDYLSNVW